MAKQEGDVLKAEISAERALKESARQRANALEAKLAEERAARLKAEGERDEARARVRKWEDHEVRKASCCVDNEKRAIDAEARLRAVIEAADGLLTMTRDLLRRLDSHEPHEIDGNGARRAIARYQGVRDAQASPEPEASKQARHAFHSGLDDTSMTCIHCGLPWSQHGGRDAE